MPGFHITDIVALLEKAQDYGIKISCEGDELVVKAQKPMDKEFLQELKANKQHLIDYFKEHRQPLGGQARLQRIPAIPREAHTRIPLSFSQERLWFIDQLEGSVQYHVPASLRLIGTLNITALANALQTIINRHEVLRTVIEQEDGQPYQRILAPDQWTLEVIEETEYAHDPDGLQDWIASLIHAPFDLAKDYMLRATLIRLAPTEHVLVLAMHHIASDGWSLAVLVQEFAELYIAQSEGRAAQLSLLPIQYADYAIWQRHHLAGTVLDQHLAYWKEKLADVAPLSLPTDYSRPVVNSTRGALLTFQIDQALSHQLRSLSKAQGVTLYMTLLATFKILLSRYSSQSDICVGSVVAGRMRTELDELIGFFINTLALRSDLSANPSFLSFLQQIKQTTLGAYDHQEAPFEKVVEAVLTNRTSTDNPLFQVMFVLQNAPKTPELRMGELILQDETITRVTSMFDLSWSVEEQEEAIEIGIEYCVDLFSEATIDRMRGHYESLLRAIVANPTLAIGELTLLSPAESQQLLVNFNDTVFAYPKESTLQELFARQVSLTPDKVAVVFEQETLTYRQLDERSNQVANYLLAVAATDQSIGLLSYRGLEMVIAIWGILKSGKAYVPFHIGYPAERLQMMMEDAGVNQVLYTSPTLFASSGLATEMGLSITAAQAYAIQSVTVASSVQDCVYVMYTSGTTGRPKGIAVNHQNILKLVCEPGVIAIQSTDTVLQWSNYAFDGSTYDLYCTLLCGARLVLVKDEAASDVFALSKVLQAEQVTVCFMTTALFNNFVDHDLAAFASLRKLLFGGELVSIPHVKKALAYLGAGRIVHVYGPTETTVYATSYPIDAVGAEPTIPIGKPLANTQCLILDPQGQLVLVGVSGELFLGGDGVAMGYINNEALTQEKFISIPGQEGRWYRTGDLGRWLPDGSIAYTGRVDSQVKIRGYRIELAEIESILLQHPNIAQAIVLVRSNETGNKYLVAYVVARTVFHKGSVLAYLKTRLPDYMIPSLLMALDTLPLTSNGKVDKKALPEADSTSLSSTEYVAPHTVTEHALVEMWQSLLDVSRVGIHDNFFELGGHSLLATRVVSAIRKTLHVELMVKNFFLYPTIAQLAAYLQEQAPGLRLPAMVAQPRPELVPLSFSQERLWFIDQLEGSVQYHMPAVFRLQGALDTEALGDALQMIVNRHEALRTVIGHQAGLPYQRTLEPYQWQLTLGMVDSAEELPLQAYIADFVHAPFDLANEHMLRAQLIQLAAEEYILVVVMHHIASDGWSLSVLVKELVEIYSAQLAARPIQLPVLPIQFADYAIWQRNVLQGEVLEEQLSYWKAKLEGVEPLNFPTDFTRPAVQSSRGAMSLFRLDRQLASQLQSLSQGQGVTLYMTLLAAFNVLLSRYSGQEDICVGTSIAGRTQEEAEGLIGFFVNTLALRSDLSNNPRFTDFVQQIKETTLGAYEHQDTPFEKIVEAVVQERDMSRTPLFQVMFELFNTPEVPELKLGEVRLSREEVKHTTTLFDLMVSLEEDAEGLMGYVEYGTDLFEAETIERMIGHYESLLRAIVQSPTSRIDAFSILRIAEKEQLLVTFNDTAVTYPSENTFLDVFAAQAQATPQAIALRFADASLTYQQLEERANQVAHSLLAHGVTTDTLVPLCLERGLEMVIGLLGILKAGGAYVPIDPEYPADRIAYMLADCAATILVSTTYGQAQLGHIDLPVLALDSEQLADQPTTAVASLPQPSQLAYVIYTSGSTGKPKGAMVEHAGMLNHLFSKVNELHLNEQSIIAYTAAYTFDISVWQMLAALVKGGTTIVYPADLILEPASLLATIEQDQVSILEVVPSYLASLLQTQTTVSLSQLQYLLVTGEAVSQPLLANWFAHPSFGSIPVVNAYGPTEASDDITHHVMREAPTRSNVPLGKPIQNLHIYVLDGAKGLCPVGVPGEICVSGVGVGRGYLNNAALTAEKFIQDPFQSEPTRLYRTGDLGRWLADGTLEYLGRMDEQVKIRGYRIELGEIEAVLQSSERVSQAVVLAQSDANGQKRLVAYLVAEGIFERDLILAELQAKLPDYMVPARLVPLESLPLTANGKINKKALSAIELGDLEPTHEYVAPRTETEQRLAELCGNLLGVDRVGLHDNLFELGMHSLLVMRLAAAVQEAFQLQVSVRTFFQLPTIESLAEYIDFNQIEYAPVPVPEKRKTITL